MNGILNAISAISQWQNAGAGFVYDSTFSTNANVAGYPAGARVLRADGLGYWLNLVDGNENNPDGATPTGWVPDYTNGVTAVTMTNANVTLTSVQYGKPIIEITGTLTASLNLIFPAIAEKWIVINNTTGAYTISAITASGTGVVIGATSFIVCDGKNVYGMDGSTESNISIRSVSGISGSWGSTTTATWTANQAIVQSSSGISSLLSGVNVSINTANTVGTAGGLDSGTLAASTPYAIWLIYNPTTSMAGAILSLPSNSAPTLPSGYTQYTLIGAVVTDSSIKLMGFIQKGADYQFVLGQNLSSLPVLASGSTSSGHWLAVAISGIVPYSIISKIKLILGANDSPGTSGTSAAVASNTNYDAPNEGSAYDGTAPIMGYGLSASVGGNQVGEIIPESTNIYYSSNLSTSSLRCLGSTLNL